MGTQLIQRGLAMGQPAELCLMQHPDWVEEIHREYRAAGAAVLTTCTFNANRLRLGQSGLDLSVRECNARAVEIARRVADNGALVAGCLGPSGSTPPPDSLIEKEIGEAYQEQAEVLAEAGVDLFLIETMIDLREAMAALAACRSVSPAPVMVTHALSRGRHGFVTLAGDAAGDALKMLVDAGAFAVGANCALDSATMVPLAGRMRDFLSTPLLLQPCAGQPQLTPDGFRYPEGPEVFAGNLRKMAEIGIDMLGGCCGTTPAHIAAAACALDDVRRTK
jgi:5-methyltetrahydrofolate--homocysteine methyltransferase